MSETIERWNPPNDPMAFESFCLDLWQEIWHDPSAQQNGRKGQPQAGVDVIGQHQGKWVGVQSKQKDGLVRSKLTITELEAEVQAAKQFKPPLANFTIATTGPRDGKVQARARELTEEHKQQGLFSVEVWSWEDIWAELYRREDLLTRIAPTYWPRLVAARRRGETLTAPSRTSERAPAELAPERLTIREKSAAEIIGHVKGIRPSYRFREKVEQLYVGRWTGEPGWEATVRSLPTKLAGERWLCSLIEVGSSIHVMASTLQDVSMLRPGDSVTVSGRIGEVSLLEDVMLEDAIVRGDSIPSAPDLK